MTASEIRSSFLTFFEERGHKIVPSSPVVPHDDPTLLFANAGMNQFKDVFLGTGQRDYLRAADSQKCIRVSGKHNDLEEVGRDTYHHTFFEMLGNWSFGDYDKREAIGWAWELLTEKWGLEKNRLFATVFETDDESFELWKKETDIDPDRVLRFGRKDNFWEMGDTGPCGPSSEIHIDLTPDRTGKALVNKGDPRVMEIWNLVFIQNNRNSEGELDQLPARHVDTGMGFERVCAILQGKTSNYDTDLFTGLIAQIEQVSGKPYDKEHQVAIRVIADHVRMLTFAIADGAIPGNEGRGYVLRRVLRRAARFGRNLGMHEPFLHQVPKAVAENLGSAYPDLIDNVSHVMKVIRSEEENFNLTLDKGLEIFESVANEAGRSGIFPGSFAFKLYDTYGFPLDLTEVIAQERGLKVDVDAFTELMNQQRERSRSAAASRGGAGDVQTSDIETTQESRFVGYGTLETDATVLAARENRIILDLNPFYAESGGQVSDTGTISVGNKSYSVVDSRNQRGRAILTLDKELRESTGSAVRAAVNRERREDIQRNHSATHIVHEALRQVLGTHVHQQGSLVAPDRLRFDFPHFGKISVEEIEAIESMVNEKISENISVHTEPDVPVEEARTIPNVKMFFGDKYGDKVRVVYIDESFSIEFCGGTHVPSTKDIGVFKIVSEGSIASGTRRIEAITGPAILRYYDEQITKAEGLEERLAALTAEKEELEKRLNVESSSTKPPLVEKQTESERITLPLIRQAERRNELLEEHIESSGKEVAELKKRVGKEELRNAGSAIEAMVRSSIAVDGMRLVASRINANDMDQLKALGDTLRSRLGSGVGVLASVIDEKVALVCVVTEDLVRKKKLQAGKIVGEVAKEVGGRGGGRPHLATAGGKEISRIDKALERTKDIIRALLTS